MKWIERADNEWCCNHGTHKCTGSTEHVCKKLPSCQPSLFSADFFCKFCAPFVWIQRRFLLRVRTVKIIGMMDKLDYTRSRFYREPLPEIRFGDYRNGRSEGRWENSRGATVGRRQNCAFCQRIAIKIGVIPSLNSFSERNKYHNSF